jgi:hypothetical protein
MNTIKLLIIKLLLKSMYKLDVTDGDFDKYFETISDDLYYTLKN